MPSPHVALATLGFLVALAVTLVAAAVFADRLDRVGVRLGFTETLLGVLTAIAADAPELASSIAAILRGERDVGLGVVLGSNAFNLAAMVGLGAIIAGTVRPRRSSLTIEAIVALALLGATPTPVTSFRVTLRCRRTGRSRQQWTRGHAQRPSSAPALDS